MGTKEREEMENGRERGMVYEERLCVGDGRLDSSATAELNIKLRWSPISIEYRGRVGVEVGWEWRRSRRMGVGYFDAVGGDKVVATTGVVVVNGV